MAKEKDRPVIRKPVIDEKTVLAFATGGIPDVAALSPAEGKAVRSADGAVTVRFRPEVAALLAEEAARKGKPVEQLIEKIVAKHLKR
jgi:hypothetical protein